jgi:porphobilinogen deaminase
MPDGQLHFRGLVSSLDGTRRADAEGSAPESDAIGLGTRMAEEVLAKGGRQILDDLAVEAEASIDG